MIYKTLSIAGFDGSGGAGIQADLKTFSALGCYGMTVLTALPVQNTCGVKSCYDIPTSVILEQLHAIFEDIRPDAIKIGMLFSHDIIMTVANFLKQYALNIPLVLDPVMVAKSGHALLKPDAIEALKSELIPLSTVITPNLPEAEALLNKPIPTETSMEEAALQLLGLGAQYVYLKGGHLTSEHANDYVISQQAPPLWLTSPRVNTRNTHGTGCTLSAAITALLAKGITPKEAFIEAKNYLHQALIAAQEQTIGKGHGPVHHFHHWW